MSSRRTNLKTREFGRAIGDLTEMPAAVGLLRTTKHCMRSIPAAAGPILRGHYGVDAVALRIDGMVVWWVLTGLGARSVIPTTTDEESDSEAENEEERREEEQPLRDACCVLAVKGLGRSHCMLRFRRSIDACLI